MKLYICFLAYSGVQHIVLCFCFVCLVCPMLSVSLDCQFLIAPLVFSNVYHTPRNEVVGGYTGFTMSVRPSVDTSYVVR